MDREAILTKIGIMMRRLYPGVETYLYGSSARGEAMPDSDFDLLMLLPDTMDNKEWKDLKYRIYSSIFDIEIDENVNLSPLIMPKKVWQSRVTPFTINVNKDAIRI
ncbi:MAG: nucleotidyltransferase domain-containing protein [Muribaculaceae bacterium]|nr:nucleotidyltransferase domain-containing protein [Muribaculaceae bacterium]